jgi:hypothetical protein
MIPARRLTRRAFATVAALGLIAVVGVTLAALATLLAGDVKRTVGGAADAQLRQLLIAGEAAARASLAHDGAPGEVTLALPDELQSTGITLTIRRLDGVPPDAVRFEVTARDSDGRSATQTLHYARAGDRWQLLAAQL